ncbi:ABC2 homolog 12 [Prunus dulcis]|uniref:ABC2 homolog 12 n=1 Tax=Prunus dulcis TaxID=3755 RepID=A0A4Y1RM75_PRUDU|nr:ABC2 homolog 12 [Prunus dulcis]
MGTVAENIGYRDLLTKINVEMVEDAARTANADEFIINLLDGYKTNIGPRDSSLSGGQKHVGARSFTMYTSLYAKLKTNWILKYT